VAKFEADAQARTADWQAQRAAAQEELKAAEANVPADLRPQYNRTIASLGHDGFAVLRDGNCTACYTDVIHQDVMALQREQFVTCKSCGRILYLPSSERPAGSAD